MPRQKSGDSSPEFDGQCGAGLAQSSTWTFPWPFVVIWASDINTVPTGDRTIDLDKVPSSSVGQDVTMASDCHRGFSYLPLLTAVNHLFFSPVYKPLGFTFSPVSPLQLHISHLSIIFTNLCGTCHWYLGVFLPATPLQIFF